MDEDDVVMEEEEETDVAGSVNSSKKSPSRSLELEDDEFSHFRTSITFLLRSVFESDAELSTIENRKWSYRREFVNLCKQINEEHPDDFESIVIDEIRFRLNFFLTDCDHTVERNHVFVYLVLSALSLHFENVDSTLLYFICTYVIKCSDAFIFDVRANSLRIIAYIFKYWYISPENDEENLQMDILTRDKLYSKLRIRQKDKVSNVRLILVESLELIQDMEIPSDFYQAVEKSPRDMLFAAMQDLNPIVQSAAVKALIIKDTDFLGLQKVAQLAGACPIASVRKDTIVKLGLCRIFEHFPEQTMDILITALEDPIDLVKETAKTSLLANWLIYASTKIIKKQGRRKTKQGLGKARLAVGTGMIWLLKAGNYEKHGKRIDQVIYSSMDLFLTSTIVNQTLTPSELITFLVSETYLPTIIHRYNKENLLNNQDYKPLLTYIWRCMVEWCLKKTGKVFPKGGEVGEQYDVVAREECLQRLTPPLVEMVSLVEKAWTWNDLHLYTTRVPPIPAGDYSDYQNTLANLLKICTLIEQEQFGGAKLRDLLYDMVQNINLHKSVTDMIANCLLNVTYEPAEPFISFVFEKINLQNVYDGTPIDAENQDPQSPSGTRHLDKKEIQKIFGYAVQLLHGIVMTGRIEANSRLFTTVLDDIAGKSFGKATMTTQAQILQIAGALMLENKEVAQNHAKIFDVVLDMGGFRNKPITFEYRILQALAIRCMFDVIRTYGMKEFKIWRKKDINFIAELVAKIDVSNETIADMDEGYHFACCEVACKWLLTDPTIRTLYEDQIAILSALMILYFRRNALHLKRFRNMFQKFVIFYVKQSRLNQARVFLSCMAALEKLTQRYDGGEETLRNADIERIYQAASLWCGPDISSMESAQALVEEHFIYEYLVIQSALKTLAVPQKPSIVELLTRLMNKVEIRNISPKMANTLKNVLELAYKNLDDRDDSSMQGAWKTMIRVRKELTDLIDHGKVLDPKENENENMKKKNIALALRAKRLNSGTTQKYFEPAKKVTFQSEAFTAPAGPSREERFPRAARSTRRNRGQWNPYGDAYVMD